MDITVNVSSGGTVTEEEHNLLPGSVLVLMLRSTEDGKVVVESYEPPEIDRHPDTLSAIGSRIVDFAK